nr:ABC transporter ATP-binding protein [uncultured Cohaesibacter sp.]
MTDALLETHDLKVAFSSAKGSVQALRGVSLSIKPGETLALVGESGSGKSTFARALLRLNRAPFINSQIDVSGRALLKLDQGPLLDLVRANKKQLNRVRAQAIAMLFQDALSALNPLMRVGRQIGEALQLAHPGLNDQQAWEQALNMLNSVGIEDAAQKARQYPHQFSGGQRQRVMIAIAAIRSPLLMIADEPTTALDVSVEALILELLKRLQVQNEMAMLFITHDLGTVAKIADRVAVMYAGQVLEEAPVDRLFSAPRHPYTKGLLLSRPGHRKPGEGLKGSAPTPDAVPSGCAFMPRCPYADQACSRPQKLLDGVRCVRPLQ